MAATRRHWDEHMSAWFEQGARPRWAAAEPYWGIWRIPQSRLPVLPADLADAVAVEFGCGSGYVSAWLARRGARPVGVDISARQLAVARRLQGEFGLRFPLIQADAERVPLGTGCAGLVISEYGASVWCDPYRWIPEAARLLRPGGRLVFMAQSTLARMCMPEQGPASDRLVHDLFGLHRVVRQLCDVLGQPVGIRLLDGLDDPRVQCLASLLEKAGVHHLLSQHMFEGVFRLRKRMRLVQELARL